MTAPKFHAVGNQSVTAKLTLSAPAKCAAGQTVKLSVQGTG
jgi:hypothetical protein